MSNEKREQVTNNEDNKQTEKKDAVRIQSDIKAGPGRGRRGPPFAHPGRGPQR